MKSQIEEMAEAIETKQRFAEKHGFKRCIEGEAMVFVPFNRALVPGHIYSENGMAEARISGLCEYHFDRWFEPGWVDPITGEEGNTPDD